MISLICKIFILLPEIILGTEYLPLYGAADHTGYFYTELFIGSQESSRKLIIEIGFDLFLIRCSGCKSCGKSFYNHYYDYSESSESHTLISKNRINYSTELSNGSNCSGFMIRDIIKFYSKNSIIQLKPLIGCSTSESGYFFKNPSDGILGFPTKKTNHSFLKFLSDQYQFNTTNYSICIGDLGGYIALGVPNLSINSSNQIWLKLHKSPIIKVKNIYIGVEKVPFSSNEQFLISTGTTLTYLKKPLYKPFMKLFKEYCKNNNNCESKSIKVKKFPGACYQHSFHNLKTFPTLKFITEGGEIEFRPEGYMIKLHFSKSEIFCFGILMMLNKNILGTNFMKFKNFHFDVENERLGLAESQCDFLPNVTQVDYFMYEIEKNKVFDVNENLLAFFCIIALIYMITVGLMIIIKSYKLIK